MASDAGLLELAAELQARHEAATSVEERKARGQIFTPPAVCRFMARLFSAPAESLRLLDPGAGVGSLTAAVCERLLALRSPRRIELHAFEDDPRLVPRLEAVLKRCARALETAGHKATFAIHEQDFILGRAVRRHQTSLFEPPESLGTFDGVIMNPPYFKIGGGSEYAEAMADVVHGQPNIYALFMAQGAELLRPGGELVAITPRSFCNGLYFREFRRWYFSRMGLRDVHLLASRKETFSEVLQESVITAARRLGTRPKTVRVSASLARELAGELERPEVPAEDVLDPQSRDYVVTIPTSPSDVAVIELVRKWPATFADLGLRVSTGPVVMFRARRFLLKEGTGKDVIPLILVNNVRPFRTEWPRPANGKPRAFRVCEDSMRLLVPTRNYLLLRRFSAKEERRRLVASPLLASELRGRHRALENHLNYVYHADRELTEDEVWGLAAIYNSELYDRYFRTFSGNTQVNATEVRTMWLPDLATIARLGRRARRLQDPTSPGAERIVLEGLGVRKGLSSP